MDRPSFWIAWGIICLVLTGIIGTIINNYGAAFFVSITIIVLICAIWIFVDREKKQSLREQREERGFKASFHWDLNESEIEFDDQREEVCLIADNKSHYIPYKDIITVDLLYSPDTYTERGWAGCIAGSLIGGMGMSILGGLATSKHYDAIRVAIRINKKNFSIYAPVFRSPAVIENEYVQRTVRNACAATEKLQSIIEKYQAPKSSRISEQVFADNGPEKHSEEKSAAQKKRSAIYGPRAEALQAVQKLDDHGLLETVENFVEDMREQYRIMTSSADPEENGNAYEGFFLNAAYLMELSPALVEKLNPDFVKDDTKSKCEEGFLFDDGEESYDGDNEMLIDDIKDKVGELRRLYPKVFTEKNYSEEANDDFLLSAVFLVDYNIELLCRLAAWSGSHEEEYDQAEDESEW